MKIHPTATPREMLAITPGRVARIFGVRGLVLVALVGLAAACALSLTPAFAANPPQIESRLEEERVYSTRAHIVARIEPESTEVTWRAEYATSVNGPWTFANSGTISEKASAVSLGADPAEGVLHHLKPETTYYARFTAENSAKEAAAPRIFEFKTLAAAKPEVAESFSGGGYRTFDIETGPSTPTSAVFSAQIESNGLETKYAFEYALAEVDGQSPGEGSASWVPFTPAAAGTITVGEDFAVVKGTLTGLAPETKYYARVKMTNADGTVVQRNPFTGEKDGSFTTPTARPVVVEPTIRNVTGSSAHVSATVIPHDLKTEWRFEYATSEVGPWTVVPGAEGTISQAEAEALVGEGADVPVQGSLAGLAASKTYYVRLFAESEAGEGHNGFEEPIVSEKRAIASFETFGAPKDVETLAVHGVHGEALRLIGAVNPASVPTSAEQTITVTGATGGTFTLSFKGQKTAPIAFDAPAKGPEGSGSVENALNALPTIAEPGESKVVVTGPAGGPYTLYFYDFTNIINLEAERHKAYAEVEEPAITADSSGLTSGAVSVTVDEVGGRGYDTHYHFEYVSQKQFEAPGSEGGFAKANSTLEADLGTGDSIEYVGADLPALEAGETYRFRMVATNNSPGNPVLRGEEQSLTVPTAPAVSAEGVGGCPNEAVRTGPSALLPDCRAFEQLTPVDKGGAQEIFNYGGTFGVEGAVPGESGDNLEYGSPTVKWGAGEEDPGQSPYFFTRTNGGWRMTAATAQPEAGVASYHPQVLDPSLSGFGFAALWNISPGSISPNDEFMAGPPGGPYTTVAVIPASEATPGWVAASGNFSKLILEVGDHALLGKTHTLEGDDLYEYSKDELHQTNVTGPAPGKTIGSCGALLAGGREIGKSLAKVQETNAQQSVVSYDGSRVFFEAVPGKDCSEAKQLYVRVNGGTQDAETVDVGAYRFVQANREGTEALLEKPSGENPGLYLYKSGSTPEFLPGSEIAIGGGGPHVIVSRDLSTVYIPAINSSTPAIYRYNVADRSLRFVTQARTGGEGGAHGTFYSVSPNGRDLYFGAQTVAGLPSGGGELVQPHAASSNQGHTAQVFRYDSVEESIECMSCASPFDPEPKLSALFTEEGNGHTVASANGDYVFFDTPAALLPADVDGEVTPEEVRAFGGEHGSSNYSVSSDVYEWRRGGVGGCVRLQGCLALITTGHGGFLNILLGTTSSGDDVFFATEESLLPSDNDTAEDIYDARVDGGFPEPARPVECGGDACSTPFAPPGEVTPSSATFQGAGNVVPAGISATKGKAQSKPSKPVCKTKSKKKCKTKKKAGKKAKHAARHAKSSARGRAGTSGRVGG